jgi:hypothetical protein
MTVKKCKSLKRKKKCAVLENLKLADISTFHDPPLTPKKGEYSEDKTTYAIIIIIIIIIIICINTHINFSFTNLGLAW